MFELNTTGYILDYMKKKYLFFLQDLNKKILVETKNWEQYVYLFKAYFGIW